MLATCALATRKSQGWPGIRVNSEALIGILSQTAGSTYECWAGPVNFTFAPQLARKNVLGLFGRLQARLAP